MYFKHEPIYSSVRRLSASSLTGLEKEVWQTTSQKVTEGSGLCWLGN